MDVNLTSYSAKLSDINVLALYWGSKGDRKISLNFYGINFLTGVITSQGANLVNTLTMIYVSLYCTQRRLLTIHIHNRTEIFVQISYKYIEVARRLQL
jgi:hypothetical protein